MNNQLTEQFLNELFKQIFKHKEVLHICQKHLKYQYLPNESYKKILKAIFNFYSLNQTIPSFGIVSQQFQNNADILELLANIKSSPLINRDILLKQLEDFLRQVIFIESYETLAEVYNQGDKLKAYQILKEQGDKINSFSIYENTEHYESIFGNFENRNKDRIINSSNGLDLRQKIPIGIDELDAILHGGLDVTDTLLFLAQSGVGKTKLLRWLGISAARRGFKVLHIQAEGSEEECLRGYDSTWTGIINELVQAGVTDTPKLRQLSKAVKDIKGKGGDIFVHSYEQFNMPDLKSVRQIILDIEKTQGSVPDLILLDYLELFNPGDGKHYKTEQERERRRALGRGLKNIAIEFNTRIATATQASSVDPKLLEDPNFVMTRYNLSEFKNATEPFSGFITLNQTKDEKRNNIMRLYVDKFRNYPSTQTIKIIQSYNNDRFYDRRKTLENYYFPEED